MRMASKLLLATFIISLSGCSSIKSFFGSSPRNKPAELTSIQQSMPVQTKWTVSVGGMDSYAFSPSLSEGYIYAASADGGIVKVDASTGRVEWKIRADTPLTSGTGSSINTVAVAGEKGKVLAFDSDGKLRWTAQASSEVISPPAVYQGMVIVHSVDNRIAAFDIESGNRRWVSQRTAPPLALRVPTGITVSGPAAFISLPAGKLLAFGVETGVSVWESTVAEPRGATELERVADTVGFPVIVGTDVCAVAYQGRVGCFDAVNGTPRWGKTLSAYVGVGADERFVFAADEKGAVSAFSRELGASVWKNDKLAYRKLSVPVSIGRAVAVGDFEGYVHFLSREDGAFLARIRPDGSAIPGTPLIVNDTLVLQTRSGSLVALSAN
jgi:outer membrane protein assembly factor BamB